MLEVFGNKDIDYIKEFENFLAKEKTLAIFIDTVYNLKPEKCIFHISQTTLSDFLKTFFSPEINREEFINCAFDWEEAERKGFKWIEFWEKLDKKWLLYLENLETKKEGFGMEKETTSFCYEKPQINRYHFKDQRINFKKLCIDAFYDNAIGFICIYKNYNLAYTGVLVHMPISKDALATSIQPKPLGSIMGYDLHCIDPVNISIWVADFKRMQADIQKANRLIEITMQDHARSLPEKNKRNFKVLQVGCWNISKNSRKT